MDRGAWRSAVHGVQEVAKQLTHTQLEANQTERLNDPFLSLFVLCRPPVGWMMLIHSREGHLLCSVHQFKH